MPAKKLPKTELKKVVDAYIRAGENLSAAARELDMSRSTFRNRLHLADEQGMIEIDFNERTNAKRHRPFQAVRDASIDQFDRVYNSGTYKTVRRVDLKDDKPFVLIALGDPHLDNKGTDLNLWEKWIAPLENAPDWVRGVCLGDMIDNWLRFLGFLYADSEITEQDGWTLVEEYLSRISLDAVVGGNHDLWKNEYALDLLAREFGMNYRANGITLGYRTPMGRTITVGMRHRFNGHSQWNTVHAIMKAASLGGWHCNALIGGDKHVSGYGFTKESFTNKIIHMYQLAAFKLCDDYAEDKGFTDQHITPATALVIDPRREDDDPQLIVTFHEAQAAVDYCEFIRGKN